MVAFGNILIVFIFVLDYTYSVSRPQITDLGDLNFLASWEPVENYTGMYNLTALSRKRKNLCYTNATSCFLGGKLLEDEDCPMIKGIAITLTADGTEPRRNYVLNNIFRVGPPNVQSLKIESTNTTIEVQGGQTPLYFDEDEEKFRGASWRGEKSPIFMGQWETRRVLCKYNLTDSSGLNASHEVEYFFDGELSRSEGKLYFILEKLKPFSSYSISVWCSLNRHDSRITVYNFTTKEDDQPTTPRIAISKPSSIVAEGTEDLEILCDLAEGWPRPELVWISPNNPSLSLDQVTLSNGSQLLIFSGVDRANAGMYRCVANNSAPLTSSADHQLVVEFPSTIRNKDDNTEHALEGENVIFICEAEGKPIPTITWLQLRNQSAELDNGILVTQSEQRTVYSSLVTSTLIIAEVKPEMYNTTFSCVANNSYGTDRKNFHLKKPDPESQKKLGPAMISVAFIMLTVILLILIFVIIRWWISRKNKHGQEQSKSQRSKNVHNSDPSSSIEEDKPYAELSNTGMETRKHDNMPLHGTPMELGDRSPPNKEDEPLIC